MSVQSLSIMLMIISARDESGGYIYRGRKEC